MKKLFILLFIMLLQTVAWSQVKEISGGIVPYGQVKLKNLKLKMDLASYSHSISKPAFHIGFTIRKQEKEDMYELFYAKENLIDETGLLNIETNHFAFYKYFGYTINHWRRVQFPIYGGIGLSCFPQRIFSSLLSINFGGRVRMRIYVTNRVALYAGGYFVIGIFAEKENPNVMPHSGLETGLLFNF